MSRSSDTRGQADPVAETDPVAEKLRAAGPRPPLPPVDFERLGAPALAVWQEKVARKRLHARRRTYLALAAALLVAVIVVQQRPVAPPEVATVCAYAGPAPDRHTVGSALDTGTVLRTGAQPAEWLTVALGDHILRLDAGSELRLEAASRIELLRGALYLETSQPPLRVRAAGTEIEHIGTRFEVRLRHEGEVVVRVRDGRVRVRGARQWTELGRGEQALGAAGGDFSLSESLPTGDSWDWIRQAAPPFDSDGASLERVLGWLAGEAGWQLEIDAALYFDAGQPVEFRGSIDRLSLEDALRFVLQSAGLRHRFDGDRLIIEAS